MPNSLSNFLAKATPKAVADVVAAFDRLPEDKRAWSPSETSRTAINQLAEVAILNGSTADTIVNKQFRHDFTMEEYFKELETLSADWNTLKTLLDANTTKVVSAILTITDADLTLVIDSPFGPLTMEQVMSYPYWNACYHEGQINYIASILGCLN